MGRVDRGRGRRCLAGLEAPCIRMGASRRRTRSGSEHLVRRAQGAHGRTPFLPVRAVLPARLVAGAKRWLSSHAAVPWPRPEQPTQSVQWWRSGRSDRAGPDLQGPGTAWGARRSPTTCSRVACNGRGSRPRPPRHLEQTSRRRRVGDLQEDSWAGALRVQPSAVGATAACLRVPPGTKDRHRRASEHPVMPTGPIAPTCSAAAPTSSAATSKKEQVHYRRWSIRIDHIGMVKQRLLRCLGPRKARCALRP